MQSQQNRDFKYVIQDTSHVYLGAKMTLTEMISFDDVPFKWQAIVNKYFMKEDNGEDTLPQLLFSLNENDFSGKVVKQLKLRFKVGEYVEKRGKKVYQSNNYSAEDFLEKFQPKMLWNTVFPEEIIIPKLALMMIPI